MRFQKNAVTRISIISAIALKNMKEFLRLPAEENMRRALYKTVTGRIILKINPAQCDFQGFSIQIQAAAQFV